MQSSPSASRAGLLTVFGIAGGLVVAGIYLYNRPEQSPPEIKTEPTGIPRAQLRHDHAKQPAKTEQVAADSARLSDSYTTDQAPPFPDDDVTVIEFTAEMRGDTLHGSWNIFFGPDLFRNTPPPNPNDISMPVFAKYEVTVSNESLQSPYVSNFEASAGENTRSMEELASQLSPGTYTVSLFIHVQYVDQYGTNKVLNKSIPALEVELR
jgi:hypothetical protein